MNYWYIARPNELFLDIDNASKSLRHARARLQGAIECGKLDVAYVMQRPSKSKDHIHVIVTLKDGIFLGPMKYAWEIILHGDLYRACCNIARWHYSIPATDILISAYDIFTTRFGKDDYLRLPDDKCNCKEKHNRATMETCPAAERLRGKFRNAGFFGKPSKNPCTIWPEMESENKANKISRK